MNERRSTVDSRLPFARALFTLAFLCLPVRTWAQSSEPREVPAEEPTVSREPRVSVPNDSAPPSIHDPRALENAAERAIEIPGDPRSYEIFDWDCESPLGRRQVTLFGNGTLRRREGKRGNEQLGLAELSPEELLSAVARLRGEDLSEIRDHPTSVDGEWVERCHFALAIPGQTKRVFEVGRYDAMPLALSRVVRVAEDLALSVTLVEGDERLPPGYEPHRYDRLRRTDGIVFEVVGFTDDNRGVELRGLHSPLTIYIAAADLRQMFVALVTAEESADR